MNRSTALPPARRRPCTSARACLANSRSTGRSPATRSPRRDAMSPEHEDHHVDGDAEAITFDQAADEARELTATITQARDAYYVHDAAEYSDAEYDELMHRLEELERLFPSLQSHDSPTQTVGGRAQTTLFAPI